MNHYLTSLNFLCKKICWPVLLVLYNITAFAQQTSEIKGVVTTSSGNALAGASVLVQGTNKGATTNNNGQYKINAAPGDSLIFHYVGFEEQHIAVGNRTSINVVLQSSSGQLNDVVVVGYGTQKKKDLTGSIASLTSKDIKNEAVTNVQTAIVGKIPGVYAATTSGQPGSGAMIRIRGFGTVNSNNPLFVVDGQFLDNINSVNPNDIDRIEVLKDASATAIYGSRGANGVIVITTKKGINGPPQINFDGYVGAASSTFTPDIANNTQLYNFLKESYENDSLPFPDGITKLYERGVNTNWWDVCTQTGLTQNYNISVRGGSPKLKSALSLGYVSEDGFLINTFYNRYNLHYNTEYQVSSKITVGADVNLASSNQRVMDLFSEPVWQIISADPFSYVYSPWADKTDPNYQYDKYAPTEWAYADNPLFLLKTNNAYRKQFNLYGNAYANVELMKGLTYRMQFSFDRPDATGGIFYPTFNAVPSDLNMGRLKFRTQNQLNYAEDKSWNTIWQHTLTYSRDFGKHNLTVLAGLTNENAHEETFSTFNTNFPSNDEVYWVLSAATGQATSSGNILENSILSYLGRINYAYADRYLATVSFRTDGSSRFAKENRWGYFPSFSLGWRLSNEPFFQSLNIGAISSLKIRGGWGQTGNQNISNSATITTISTAPYQVYVFGGTAYPAYGPRNIGNAGIRWESSEQTNIGLDATLFKNLSITADYFIKNTNGMLLRTPVPNYTGYPNAPYTNAGSVRNKGFELGIDWRGQKGNFSYGINANAATYKNEVTSLGEGDNPIYGTGFKSGLSKTEVGHPIGMFFGYKWLGIFQTPEEIRAYTGKNGQLLEPLAKPGDFKFADTNGDGVLNDNDRTYIGNPHPGLVYGFGIRLGWKNFDFSSAFSGTLGNDMWNENKAKYFVSIDNVQAIAYTDAWRKPGDNTTLPRISQLNQNNNGRSSSWYVENGSYLRLKNMQLGYTLPENITGNLKAFSSLHIYLSAQNLFTLTKYTGMDPEVGNDDPTHLGFEITRYPAMRTLAVGINAQF